jgi:hypothetical protein
MQIKNQNGVWNAYDNSGTLIASSKNRDYLGRKLKNLNISLAPAPFIPKVSPFDINERFNYLDQLVRLVANGQAASCIITGEGGLGKSYTVTNALKEEGLKDVTELESSADITDPTFYRIIKGYSTPKGLFKSLYENQSSVVVYDDCDSVLKDADAVNLLKGALDSFDKRLITWNTSVSRDELPSLFEFKGGIIFISNMNADNIDQAIRSRSMCVDVSMTNAQKIERMDLIMRGSKFLPFIPLSMKVEALDLIKELEYQAKEISLRTLITVSKIRDSGNKDWRNLAKYLLIG